MVIISIGVWLLDHKIKVSARSAPRPFCSAKLSGLQHSLHKETSLFQIAYRDDITTAHVIRYKGDLYEIARIDRYEGYKNDLRIYGKLKE